MESVDSDVDALFQLALPEFTAARNALASRLQKAGAKDDAARIKGLPKPPISAWVVNQLYWKFRDVFDRLLTTGGRLRQAQAAQLAGHPANLRELMTSQRETLNELLRHATTTLRETGHPAGPDVLRRVSMTLEGLAARGLMAGAPAPGRLTEDVDPPGFEAVAALAPRGTNGHARNGDARVLAFRADRRPEPPAKAPKKGSVEAKAAQEKQRRAAQAAVKDAERAVRDAKVAEQKAEEALKKAAARVKETEKDKRDAEARLEKASAQADAARQAARKVAADAADAAQIVEDAERALAAARQLLSD